LPATEVRAGPIGNSPNLECKRKSSLRRGLKDGRCLIFLALFGGWTLVLSRTAWSQQGWAQQGLLPPSTPGPEAVLPDGPDPRTSAGVAGAVAHQDSAQVSAGSIHGVVMDKDGAVCEGATVDLDDAGTSATAAKTATSDSNGRFSFSDIPPGAFRLTLSSKGFETQVVQGELHPGENFEARAIELMVTSTSEVRVTASQVEIAVEQVREEEQQRVLGVIPNFYVSYAPNAAPLTVKQKFDLGWKSSIDPVSFLAVGFFAGIEQAENTFSGYGQGAQGYAKRYGAGYANSFIGTMLGSAILPSWWKQDPRYFYKGTGTTRSRALYAIANSVICKGDNGKWQPNYSGIVGGLAAGGISNLYYPASDRDGLTLTFENAALGAAEGAVQNLIQEFVIRKLTPKLPSYGSGKP
jgi:hypothetical protein